MLENKSLVVQDNIRKELCFYLVKKSGDLIDGRRYDTPIYIQGRNIFRAEYALALEKQNELCNLTTILSAIDSLLKHKMIPISLYPQYSEVKNSKHLRRDMKKLFSDIDTANFHRFKLIKIAFRPTIIAYFEERIKFENEIEIYFTEIFHLFNCLKQLNNSSSSAISFDESVQNLYNKIVKDKVIII